MGVGTAHSKHGLLMQVSCGIGAKCESKGTTHGTQEHARRRWPCEPQYRQRQEIPHANTPSREQRRSTTHADPRRPRNALNTSSTLTCSSDLSGTLPRL